MSRQFCEREDELLEALARGFLDPDLSAHLEACVSCGELGLVAGALLDDRTMALSQASLPAAGTMWWRLQLRRQQEAQAAARRALFIGQALTLTIALVLTVSLLGAGVTLGFREFAATVRLSTPLLVLLGTWLLCTPLAGYVALRQK